MSDEELVRACIGGDLEAFRGLVEKYAERVYSFCYRRVLNRDDAKDLAQETFVSAYASIGTLRNGADFGGWAFGIARNKCKMHLRRLATAEASSGDGVVEASVEVDADEELRLETLRRLLDGLVERLPAEQREVVELFYWDGLTYDEISEAVCVPRTTVKSRLHEARKALKEVLRGSIRRRYRTQGIPVHFADQVLSLCGEGCECGLTLSDEGGA